MFDLTKFLKVLDACLAIYFVTIGSIYTIILISSWLRIRQERSKDKFLDQRLLAVLRNENSPKVSIVIPALNEEKIILASIGALTELEYIKIELIVVDDGSTDATARTIIDHYKMISQEVVQEHTFSKGKIFETYYSSEQPNLKLIRQENSGKAVALNSGIELSSGELVCTMDADTIIDSRAILLLVEKYMEDPENTVGLSGTVRILNGAQWNHSEKRVRGFLPNNIITRLQIVEYIRAFYSNRIGWDNIGATIFMSGALSMFKKKALIEVGGFNPNSLTEDFEIVLRMRKFFGEHNKIAKFKLIPNPICWTQAPEDLSSLRNQRIRWHQGLCETLIENYTMLFNPKFGIAAITSIPYVIVFEWLGPIIELVAYFAIGLSLYLGLINLSIMETVFAIGFVHSVFLTIFGVYLEQKNYAHKKTKRDAVLFLLTAIWEYLGYRQLYWWWRLEAMTRMLSGKRKWITNQRQKFNISSDKKSSSDAA